MLTAPITPTARNSAPSASSASRRSMSIPPMTAIAFVRRDGRQRPLRVSPPMIATTQRRSLPGGAGGGARRARGGQVGGQDVEVSAGARRVGELDALGELLERQPALAAGDPQAGDRRLAVGVGDAQLRRLAHAAHANRGARRLQYGHLPCA